MRHPNVGHANEPARIQSVAGPQKAALRKYSTARVAARIAGRRATALRAIEKIVANQTVIKALEGRGEVLIGSRRETRGPWTYADRYVLTVNGLRRTGKATSIQYGTSFSELYDSPVQPEQLPTAITQGPELTGPSGNPLSAKEIRSVVRAALMDNGL